MKNLILIIAIVFSGMLGQAQTDLEIVNAIMGKKADQLQPVADSLGLQISYDGGRKLMITTADGVTLTYKIWRTTIYKSVSAGKKEAISNIIIEVFTKYKLWDSDHNKRYSSYDLKEPAWSDDIVYVKEHDHNVGYFRATNKRYIEGS